MTKSRRLPSLGGVPEAAPRAYGWPSQVDDAIFPKKPQERLASREEASEKSIRLPVIDYENYKMTGDTGSGIKHVILEGRGIRELVLQVFDNPIWTLFSQVLRRDDPEGESIFLSSSANTILSDAGEKPLSEASDLVKEEGLQEGSTIDSRTLSLLWQNLIANKHGYLSPEATAADFLAAADRVSHMLGGDEEKMRLIFAFCEAWHWFHMEATSEHALAYAGVKATRDRMRAAPMARIRKQTSETIIAAEYDAYCQREHRENWHKATSAASAILGNVNARLTEQGLKNYTEGSLRKFLGQIIKARNSVH